MNIGKVVKEYTALTMATVILDVGIYLFKFPNNFSFGGVSGLSIILDRLFSLSASQFNLSINMALVILGFLFLGKGFGTKTVYVSILSSVGLSVMEYLFPMSGPLTDQPMLELVFAVILPSCATALLFNMDASSGGTDIIAMILRKYTSVDIGVGLFIVDLAVCVSAFLVFDVKTGLYSFCGLMAKSLVIDGVIENINLCKFFTIITDSPELICDYIHVELNRSATVTPAEGAFTGMKKYVILSVVSRHQAVLLRNFVKKEVPGSFMMITNSSEIIGKGFHGFYS
ncbi:MAG: YitT family protein [Fusicatenibacter sp.]|nr:YitT family protein [Lachnospiraceae bacterium]MDY2937421.1 YitT family protein [Fusicatenibacter sp.]